MISCQRNILTLLFGLLYTTPAWSQMIAADSIGRGWAGNSVNTAVFRKSAVDSHRGISYAAYYNDQGNVVLATRHRGQKWITVTTSRRGNIYDAHNVINIAVDGDGFLHMAWNHHNDSLHYCRSIAPGSMELGPMLSMVAVDETSVTYPEFHRLPSGDLIFLYRDGQSGKGNLIMNRYDLKTKQWRRIQSVLIDGEGQRNAYWQAHVDKQGSIHLSWVWRESWDVATNHDLCYARSNDGGVTWKKSDGKQYKLPITAASAEYAIRISQRHELINQTSMYADGNGNPYIATYWRADATAAPQYFVVWHDGKIWRHEQVGLRMLDFSLSGGGTKKIPISRPQVVVERNGIAHIIFRDQERNNAICEYSGIPGKASWSLRNFGFDVGTWEPSYDPGMLREQGILRVFVQRSGQGDGEQIENLPPQTVFLLTIRADVY